MSGFQPGGFNFGFPQTSYSAPLLPTDGLSSLAGYGNQGSLNTAAGPNGGVSPEAFGGGGLGDWFKNSGIMNSTNGQGVTTQGWGMPALGVASGLLSAFMGMKQYGLAKDSLAEGKRQFGLNYDAQRQTTNTQLEDRQRARVASNGGAYQSVGDYMSANGIKGG